MLRLVAAIAAVVVVAGVAIAFMQPGTSERRFKLAVELEVDGQTYAGSTVWSLQATLGKDTILDPNGPTLETRGEAIDFALADGKTLFFLRRGHLGPPSSAFGGEFLICVPGETGFKSAAALATFDGGCEIPLFPKIVVSDKNGILETLPYDPKTKSGPRVTIVSMFATTTDEPISSGIVDRHPWIATLPHTRSTGPSDITFFEDFSRR